MICAASVYAREYIEKGERELGFRLRLVRAKRRVRERQRGDLLVREYKGSAAIFWRRYVTMSGV